MPNYLKYSIHETNGKLALFDDNGAEVEIHNSITPKDKVYFTTWCVLLFSKKRSKKELFPQSISFLAGRYAMLWQDVEYAIEFRKNGLVGWKTPDGKLIMPPIFERLEKCKKFIWARYFNRELFIYKNGGLSDEPKFDNVFYQKGKKGINNPDGTILFPAIYDEIYQWHKNSDVFYTLIGKEFHYYNSKHEEILTTYKKFDGIDDEFCPYYIFERQSHGVLVTMQITDSLSDSQSCICFGQKVRLDRILKSDVEKIVQTNCEVWNKGIDKLRYFNSYFTYIYSGYWAESNSETPIEDCINQFVKMDCYDTSWAFIVKMWTNRQTVISSQEFNKLICHFQDLDKAVFGICNPMDFVTIGYDDTLPNGTVKMFQVRYVFDRPPNDYDDIYDEALNGNIDNYLKKKQILIDTLHNDERKENRNDNYYQSVYDDILTGNSIGSGYHHFDKNNVELLDYLIEKEGFSVEETIFRVCQRMVCNVKWGISISTEDAERAYQKIKWLLRHKSSLLSVVKGQSSLDLIQESILILKKTKEEGHKTKLQILKKIERLLIKHGALTAEEIRKSCKDLYLSKYFGI